MKLLLLPLFENIFKGEQMPLKEDLLKGVSSDAIIRACCHINAELRHTENVLEKEKQIFIDLMERIPDDKLRNFYYSNLEQFILEANDRPVALFPAIHTLKLIEESFLNYTEGSFAESNPEQDLSILKLLLIHNHEANENLSQRVKKNEDHPDRMYQLFWTSLLSTSTFMHEKDFIISIYKSIKFLEYLEKYKQEALSVYLQHYNLPDKMQIVLKIFEINANGYDREKSVYTSYFRNGQIDQNYIAKGLILDLVNASREDYIKSKYAVNLKGLRKFPLIRYENGDTGVLYWNFLVEKYYDGLVFDFFTKSGINQGLSNDFNEYNKDIGTDFSNPLFMDVMKALFCQEGVISYREGERNEDCNYDFYIRIRNHVFLFEFKDVFFPIKDEFENIKATIDERIAGGKGVGQIIKQIDKLATSPETFDDFTEYPLERLFIYPVIVYADSSYGMTGVNHYVNTKFIEKLSTTASKDKFFIINPLAMINFDFLLERYDSFKKGELDLIAILNSYYRELMLRKALYSKFRAPDAFLSLYDGFDTIANNKYPFKSIKSIGGELYNRTIESIKPFLARED